MEERLDDAINVLRNHAESQLGLHAALASVTHSTPLYQHAIDSAHAHLVSIYIIHIFFLGHISFWKNILELSF